ncbi:CPBP family intramembrane glutamic endopeptidase [Deinococcus sp. PESE-38]
MTPPLSAAPGPAWPEDAAVPVIQAAPPTQVPPETRPPETGPQITALSGNRAALTLLVVQNVVSAFAMGVWLPLGADGQAVRIGLGLPLGTALLLSFAVTVLVALTAFKGAMAALRADTRWRTPPSWGTALAAFVLAFLASRAFVIAYVMLVPSAADTVPEFLSRGADVVPLVLAAGLLIPLAEEIAFRGLMMRGQERAAGFGVAAVATTVAFALAHGVPASIAGILPLAYVLARLTQHTGSLWNSVIVHALNNLLAVVLGLVLIGKVGQGQSGDLLASGALRLPAALLALLFGAAVLTVLHLWLTPRPDPVERRAPGPWVSGSYVIIVLFGLALALLSLPGVQSLFDTAERFLR